MIITFLFIITFIGFLIQSIAGFGSSIFAIPISAFVITKSEVLPAFIILSAMQSIIITIQDRKYILKKDFIIMISLALIGMMIGISINNILDEKIINYIIGSYIIINSSINLYKTFKNKYYKNKKYSYLNKILPIFSGLLQTIYGIGGPLIASYMDSITNEKRTYRVMISTYWSILNPIIIITMLLNGTMKLHHLNILMYLIPAMILGIIMGNKVVDKITKRNFQITVHTILVLVGISLFL